MNGVAECMRVGPDNDPDRFRVERRVGCGAEGTLFRGSITVSGTPLQVAIKQLLPERTPVDEWHARWDRQVELLRTVQGPGVVPVREGFAGALPHAAGEPGTGRTLYLVMNWVEGESLYDWVRHRRDDDPLDTLERLSTVAAALDDMHAGRTTGGIPVVHCDIKPSNILVNEAGTVLVDFGLVRALPKGPRISGVSGTHGYIAPESHKEGVYAPPTDRYSFGAVAYFVCTGLEPPWSHDADVLRSNLVAAPSLAGRPAAVDHLMEMLDDDPSARPDSLQEWLLSLPGRSHPRPASTIAPPRPADESIPQRAERLRVELFDLAEAYMALESHEDYIFIRAQVDSGGSVPAAARDGMASLALFWERYTVAKRFVDDLGVTIAARRVDDGRRLLGPEAICLPDGSRTSAEALWAELRHRLEQAEASVHREATVAQAHGRLLVEMRTAVDEILGRAADLSATEDAEITAAEAALALAERVFTSDAWAAPPADLEGRAELADSHLRELHRRRSTLPDRLARARLRLEEISAMARDGAEAYLEATRKIRDPEGVLAPVDLADVDGDGGNDRALGPWLARIGRVAEEGGWRSASVGLDQWEAVADGWHESATRVLEANRKPKAERDLLRGRLEGFKFMAGNTGRSEDPVLARLFRAAHTVLHGAPCDLTEARGALQRYIDAVSDAPHEDDTHEEDER
jgi:hypothetical protein